MLQLFGLAGWFDVSGSTRGAPLTSFRRPCSAQCYESTAPDPVSGLTVITTHPEVSAARDSAIQRCGPRAPKQATRRPTIPTASPGENESEETGTPEPGASPSRSIRPASAPRAGACVCARGGLFSTTQIDGGRVPLARHKLHARGHSGGGCIRRIAFGRSPLLMNRWALSHFARRWLAERLSITIVLFQSIGFKNRPRYGHIVRTPAWHAESEQPWRLHLG